MKKIILLLTILLVGCATSKIQYVPVQGENVIEYRDSIVRVIDTIKVEVPRETIKEVMPIIDTSKLETSVAKSVAYVDRNKNKLVHTLENKKTQLEAKIDTVVVVQYVNKYIKEPVIQEVQVEVPYIPKWAIWLMVFGGICAVWNIAKIIGKFR